MKQAKVPQYRSIFLPYYSIRYPAKRAVIKPTKPTITFKKLTIASSWPVTTSKIDDEQNIIALIPPNCWTLAKTKPTSNLFLYF